MSRTTEINSQTEALKALFDSMEVRKAKVFNSIFEDIHPTDVAGMARHIGALRELGYWIAILKAKIAEMEG